MHPTSPLRSAALLHALLVLGLLAGSAPARAAAPAELRRVEVPGLSAPAEILVDRWGVPHIYAADQYDAFFVQGFNAARDRLWQIDLWRRRGLGRLSEVFGPAFVEQDRAARLFLYRGSMFREWLAYGSDAKRIAEAFTAGVNAFVALTERDPSRLPPEFELLDYRPARWAAEDVVRIRSHGLWRNVVSEVLRARSACTGDLDADRVRQPLEPAWTPALPAGLDPCTVPEGVLDVYLLAKAPVRFDAQGLPRVAELDPEQAWRRARATGSNNWAVAPSRTDTGRPILADDPHRSHAVPSLRYIAHLSAPGLNVIGAGEPALPGISIGHNERIAFGLTIFPMDQEDLYFYETAEGDPSRYRYGDRFERVRALRETIAVRGAEDEEVVLRFTRHGPIVHEEADSGRLWAVRAAWLEPGMAPYFGSVEYMRARNWDEFVAALNRWGAPSENQVYADVDGHIGYKPAGLLPRRPDHDGLLPVPGDGRHEWDDFHHMDALPVELDPDRGWVATANALTLPPDHPVDRVRVGFEWAAPWREERIAEVLAAGDPHRFAESVALQRDQVSLPARRIGAALAGIRPREEIDRRALELLRGFDGDLRADSAAAALFEVWFSRHLRSAVAAALLDADTAERVGSADTRVAVRAVTRPGELLDTEARDKLVRSTLIAAWADVAARLGWDPEAWRWGDLHRSHFVHPLAAVAAARDAELAAAMTLPDHPMGGSGQTPNNTRYGREDFLVRGGASFRMVLDVGAWDAGRMTNAPGQSGVPGSPHYGDLLEPWAELGSLPLLYSREAVEAATVRRIELRPAP